MRWLDGEGIRRMGGDNDERNEEGTKRREEKSYMPAPCQVVRSPVLVVDVKPVFSHRLRGRATLARQIAGRQTSASPIQTQPAALQRAFLHLLVPYNGADKAAVLRGAGAERATEETLTRRGIAHAAIVQGGIRQRPVLRRRHSG